MSINILLLLCFTLFTTIFGKNVKIVGGDEGTVREFPYAVSLTNISNNEHLCGGAIITQNHVLTAGHCIYRIDDITEKMKVVAGAASLSDPYRKTFLINKVFIHRRFRVKYKDILIYKNDIAVIKIEGTIEFNERINKIDLPPIPIVNGDIGIVSGWGSTTHTTTTSSDTLQRTWMRIIDKFHCNSLFPYTVNFDQFCGIQKVGKGICHGDSGSPLVSVGKLIGIASISLLCATGVPDIYTHVYYHRDFILKSVNA